MCLKCFQRSSKNLVYLFFQNSNELVSVKGINIANGFRRILTANAPMKFLHRR